MQQKTLFCKSHYFNTWLLLAKLLSLLIFIYISSFLISCSQNHQAPVSTAQNRSLAAESAININTADAVQLKKLPRVGEELARKIIAHRETHGLFQRAEDLILVSGMSDKKFREIRSLIKVE